MWSLVTGLVVPMPTFPYDRPDAPCAPFRRMLFVGVMIKGATYPPTFEMASITKLGPEPSPPNQVSLRIAKLNCEVLSVAMLVVVRAPSEMPAYPTVTPSPNTAMLYREGD